jgi:hypothetical protein
MDFGLIKRFFAENFYARCKDHPAETADSTFQSLPFRHIPIVIFNYIPSRSMFVKELTTAPLN